jgi:hypothetical protein
MPSCELNPVSSSELYNLSVSETERVLSSVLQCLTARDLDIIRLSASLTDGPNE